MRVALPIALLALALGQIRDGTALAQGATPAGEAANISATPPPVRPDRSSPRKQIEPAPQSDQDSMAFGPPAPPDWWLERPSEQEFAACMLALNMLGTQYTLPPTVSDPDNADCGIARPVLVDQIIPGVTLQGKAMMQCATARALALWTREFVVPAAATLQGAPRITGMTPGSTYHCRARIGTGNSRPKLSEHAKGNAIDIASFQFDGHDPVPIAPRKGKGDRIEAFQRAVRASGCLYFTTVLGPGSNTAHADHLHLDIAQRRGDWRICQ